MSEQHTECANKAVILAFCMDLLIFSSAMSGLLDSLGFTVLKDLVAGRERRNTELCDREEQGMQFSVE